MAAAASILKMADIIHTVDAVQFISQSVQQTPNVFSRDYPKV